MRLCADLDLHLEINNFFYAGDELWLVGEQFADVQTLLFRTMVVERLGLSDIEYGDVNREIRVVILAGGRAPILINREKNSGYWDYPIQEVSSDANMYFASFFAFNASRCLDHQYVKVLIDSWSSHSDAAGKYALIEFQYVAFDRCIDQD